MKFTKQEEFEVRQNSLSQQIGDERYKNGLGEEANILSSRTKKRIREGYVAYESYEPEMEL